MKLLGAFGARGIPAGKSMNAIVRALIRRFDSLPGWCRLFIRDRSASGLIGAATGGGLSAMCNEPEVQVCARALVHDTRLAR